MYFLILRPQQQRAKQQRELVQAAKRGDIVVTSGGLIGKITKAVDDSEVELEIAPNVRVRLARSGIADVRSRGEPVKDAARGRRPPKREVGMLRIATWQVVAILALVLAAVLLVVPSFLRARDGRLARAIGCRRGCRRAPITLGLDLQGGAHLLMEVDKPSLVKGQVEQLRDDVRGKLREAKIPLTGGVGVQPRGVIVRIADAAERAKALDLLQSLNQRIGGALSGATDRMLDISDSGDGAIRLTLTDAAINDKVRRAVDAIDRGAQSPPRRVGHQGDQRPAPGRRSRADRGAGPAGHHRAEEARRHDRQADIPPRRRSRRPASEVENAAEQQQGGEIPVEKRVMVSGEDLTDAQPGFDSRTGEPDVNFRFNLRGGQRFGQVTSRQCRASRSPSCSTTR